MKQILMKEILASRVWSPTTTMQIWLSFTWTLYLGTLEFTLALYIYKKMVRLKLSQVLKILFINFKFWKKNILNFSRKNSFPAGIWSKKTAPLGARVKSGASKCLQCLFPSGICLFKMGWIPARCQSWLLYKSCSYIN